MVRARQVGLFQYSAGFGSGIEKKSGAGRFGSGRSVEIFDWVFLGTLFTLGNSGISWVFPKYQVIPDISG